MKRKLVYYLIMMIIPAVLLFLVEFSLRIFNYGSDLSLFRKSESYPGYYELNTNVAGRFFTIFRGTKPSNDIFLINKPDTCYRIFVMGCSTTRGFPYKMGVTFSRILYYRLQDAFPHKRIEVINTSLTAISSYAQVDFINEILSEKPDAILIYTGHNEYYGALGVSSVENGGNAVWIKRMHLTFIRLRTYQLIKKIAGAFKLNAIASNSGTTGTLMQIIAKDKTIEYQSELYKAGIVQFRSNISKLIEKAKKAGVPVILSDVISNVNGMMPFKSKESGKFQRADSVFIHARKMEESGKSDEARRLYYLAKDLDCIRFRAPEELNEVIYNLGNRYKIPILRMKQVFEKNSPYGLIGNNLMTEHLHPNVDGQFLMADAFFNFMKENKLISQNWDSPAIKPSSFYRSHWGFTALDSLNADLAVKSLKAGWPYKLDCISNTFLDTYTPYSLEDSFAFACIKNDNIYIEEKHRELADIYISRGEYIKAYNEYFSLIKSYPYLFDLYACSVDYLDLLGDVPKALNLILSFPDKDSNFAACLKIGELYQKLSQPLMAIYYLEKADKIRKPEENPERMYVSLFKLYTQSGNTEKANLIRDKIKTFNP